MADKYLPTFILAVLTGLVGWVGNSVNDLNKNVATIIERTANHEKRIDKLENKFNLPQVDD